MIGSFVLKNSPIFAIDLIIQNKYSDILMSKRINNLAKNYFVPAVESLKMKKIINAIERISNDELGKIYTIEDTYFMNYYEHFYHNSISD